MSGVTFKGQTAWEESEEEIVQRLENAKSNTSHWAETILGLALGAAALVILFIAN